MDDYSGVSEEEKQLGAEARASSWNDFSETSMSQVMDPFVVGT